MSLTPGTRLGPYEILSPIGAGGMGEVYRARDTKLDRDVAIKVLPEEFASDAERLARFEREAKLLASLNHPNIASIHGFEESAGINALVLELVEGPTLAEKIAEGPIPVDEALAIAKQIAEALEAGHETGVIHRDLKPANIKLKEDGTVKVLDYGLAKALEGETPAGADSELSQSPTLTRQGTQVGVILGTAAYMSPEQAKGKRVDKRTDVWAFGAVLYEMLTGSRLFQGEDVSETLAAVLRADVDWTLLPRDTPGALRWVMKRSLTRDPKDRLHDIADARIELGAAAEADELPETTHRSVTQRLLIAAFAFVSGAIVATFFRGASVEAPREPQRFMIAAPRQEPPLQLSSPIISPDGRYVAYIGGGVYNYGHSQVERRLFLRDMAEQESRALPGTAGVANPFFSPDGLWIGFFSGDKLRKVSVRGGSPTEICDASSDSPGGQWAPDGSIWFSPTWVSGFAKVSADGGALTEVTTPDASRGESGHWWPRFLPDGKTVLFTISSNQGVERSRIGVLDTTTGTWRDLFEGSEASYAPSGHIVYYHSGIYQAAPFDLSHLERTGPAIQALEGTRTLNPVGGVNQFHAFSSTGTLVTVPGGAYIPTRQLSWAHRDGKVEALPFDAAPYRDARVSPDGQRLAVTRIDEGLDKIWLYDLDPVAAEKLTMESSVHKPRWTASGDRLIYASARTGQFDVLSKTVDVFGAEEAILTKGVDEDVSAVSPDGKWLAVELYPPQKGIDLALLELGGDADPKTFVTSPYIDDFASFSRDSRWLAFSSNASGRWEVYAQSLDGDGKSVKISTDGGDFSVWSPTRDELYYQRGNTIMAVSYTVDGGVLRPGVPSPLVELSADAVLADIFPDGERFLILVPTGEDPPSTELHVTLNWFEELKLLVPTP